MHCVYELYGFYRHVSGCLCPLSLMLKYKSAVNTFYSGGIAYYLVGYFILSHPVQYNICKGCQ